MFKKITNSFTQNLAADPVVENGVRQVKNACYSFVEPTPCSKPYLIAVSTALSEELNLGEDEINSYEFLTIFSGNQILEGTKPFAMCYGGHQFGQWAGQLGDGRAINLFEAHIENKIYAFQLKGAGKTPYSRSADGLAVLRSSIREFLCSEAMHHLGIPTTRALSLIGTGDLVLRDVMYNGNSAYEPGAVVCRVAPSFIRFGNFQILTAQNDLVNLKSLCDYTIEHFFPTIEKGNYLAFLNEVVVDTIHLIVEWERVGFVHGVMNTDNMSILGLTIDYGPYGWVDNFDPKWTPNTTDKHEKRYRFENQINVAYWNLYQLANAIFSLINDASAVEKILDQIPDMYNKLHLTMKSKKLGLTMDLVGTKELIAELDQLLYHSEMDMTLFYRHLSSFESSGIQAFLDTLRNCSYAPHFDNYLPRWQNWLDLYAKILDKNPSPNRKESMNLANPKYILRNYMAQLAIDKAYEGDYTLVAELYRLIRSPYDEQYEQEKWFVKRPEWAKTKVGSSMLSCSS